MRIPFNIPPPGGRPFDVVGLGENSIDLMAVVAGYPASNSKQQLQQFQQLPGGEIATALAACARLGWRCRYVGSFGSDEFGRASRESLTRDGIDITAARTVSGATNRFALVLVDQATGERTVLWDRHDALTMNGKDVHPDVIASGRMLLVDGHEIAAATEAARCARQAGIPTVVDVESVRPGTTDLLRHIDAIVVSESFPKALTGYDDPGRALQSIAEEFAAPLVCVTFGRKGSLARCNGREIVTPAYVVDSVDTTGAGDTFRGALAAACLRTPGGSVEEALNYASAAAALNCRALGARGALPTPDDVDQLQRLQPRVGV